MSLEGPLEIFYTKAQFWPSSVTLTTPFIFVTVTTSCLLVRHRLRTQRIPFAESAFRTDALVV